MQNTVIQGVIVCIDQYFLPHEPEVTWSLQVHFLSEKNLWVLEQTAASSTPHSPEHIRCGFKEPAPKGWRDSGKPALKIHTATFLSKGLHSWLPYPPWTMRETIPHHVNIWNSLIFLCPTTTALCWHWKFKETFGSSYLWFVNCQVLFNTFQTSVLRRIRTRSKFKMVPLPG